jgi:hypothetical protein
MGWARWPAENEESPLAVGSTRAGSAEPDGWPGVAGVVVAVAGVQVTAKAVGDVLRWPVAELVAAQAAGV